MTGFKILEFMKSQYSYEAIEKALSEKVSEGWKVVSMHTDVSSDNRGVVVVLLQQIIPGEEETLSYRELYEKKQAELAIKKIQKEIDDVDRLPPGYTSDTAALGAAVALGQTEAMRKSRANVNGAVNGFMGLGMMGAAGSNNANAPALNNSQALQNGFFGNGEQNGALPNTSKFCTNCGAAVGTGRFCSNCGKPQ